LAKVLSAKIEEVGPEIVVAMVVVTDNASRRSSWQAAPQVTSWVGCWHTVSTCSSKTSASSRMHVIDLQDYRQVHQADDKTRQLFNALSPPASAAV
jgi:hypothetical protein